MSLIYAENIEIRHGGTRALFDVTLAIEAGEIVTIVGPNGSGKSTLLRALIGAQDLSRGQIIKQAGLRIGYVPQTLHIDAALPMSVRRFLNMPRRVSKAKMRAALEKTNVAALENRQLLGLSGGQLQRVLLARAILNDPQVLVLDEPTQGLDQPASATFYRLIETLRDALGCAVIMVSHELHVVMSATDRVICLNGHICCEGTPEVVTAQPAYRELFGTGTGGALAIYRHEHTHDHNHDHDHDHPHEAAE